MSPFILGVGNTSPLWAVAPCCIGSRQPGSCVSATLKPGGERLNPGCDGRDQARGARVGGCRGRRLSGRVQLVQQGKGRDQQQPAIANIAHRRGNACQPDVQLFGQALNPHFLAGRAGDGEAAAPDADVSLGHYPPLLPQG